MRLLKLICLAALPLALGACQGLSKPESPQPMATTSQRWELRSPGCTAEDCPLVNVELQLLTAEPALNARIEQELLALTGDEPRPASLQAYQRDFLASAKPGWSSYLQAKIIDQHNRLVIIELSSYRFTGGAHGIPGRAFINYDRQLRQVLSLQDMLVPGAETAFWKTAEQSHQTWLVANGYDQDADFRHTWPFERTGNVALTWGAVLLKYDIGRIAPYASGHPELKIPYPRLNGVLKPEYFPQPE